MSPFYNYKAQATRVIDGDTIEFRIDAGFRHYTHQRVRLLNIDTPEIYAPNNEKELGKKVKKFVEDCLFENPVDAGTEKPNPLTVTLKTEKTGSFGRWLGIVTLPDGTKLADKILEAFPELAERQ